MDAGRPFYLYLLLTLAAAGAPGCDTRRAGSSTRQSATTTAAGSDIAFESGWIDVAGGRLYYESTGRGPALVLLHGGFGDRRMWDEQFAALSSTFRVVRYDHRGFGKSPPPDAPYSPVADLEQLLDTLGIARAHLVGNSMGGALALDFAIDRPARTDRVVVLSSGATGFPVSKADVRSVTAVFELARSRGTAAAAESWLKHPMVAVAIAHPRAGPLLRTMIEENQQVFLNEHWPFEESARPTYFRLRDVRSAVLFVLGEQDTLAVQTAVRATAERLMGARVEVVRGADHLLQMEEPQRVNRIIVNFLDRKAKLVS